MDIARRQLKKNSPAVIVQHTLRTLMTAPGPMARLAIHDLTKPSSSQKKWIKRFDNDQWKGALIAPGIKKDTEQAALERLKAADLVIYEIHGGGFRVGHCVMYMDAFISWLTILKETHDIDAVIMSIEYGLAPKVCYPGPILECVSSYQYLTTDLGVSPSKIIVSGDSAGGIISLEMLCHVYAPGLLTDPHALRTNFDIDLPAGVILSSPVISVNQTSESWKKYASTDIVSHKLFDLVIKEYIALKKNKLDKMAMFSLFNNLSHGGVEQICQGSILFFVGEKEVFRDDILAFADIIKKTTTRVKVNICKAQYAHDWYLIREIVRQDDKHILHRCDKAMAKWCDHALHHQRQIKQHSSPQQKQEEEQLVSNNDESVDVDIEDDASSIVETIPLPTVDEKLVTSHVLHQRIDSPQVIV